MQASDLPGIIRAHARTRGGVVAVESAGKQLDYQRLHACSDQVARALLASGVSPAQRVAFLARTCVEYFEFLIGCMKAGVVPVPVNWRLALPEIAAVLDDSEAVLLVVGDEFANRIEEIENRLMHVRAIVSLDAHPRYQKWSAWRGDATDGPPVDSITAADTIVLQIYTSGTTGKPKGVMTSNAGLMSYLDSLATVARFSEDAVSLSTLPLFHIGGTGWALAGIYRGATVVLLRDVKPEAILETIGSHHVTNLIAVPSVVQMLLQSPQLAGTDFRSLQYLYYGGGPMTETVLRNALEAFHCRFIQGFGMTECPLITTLSPDEHAEGRDLLRSCGRPIAGTTVRLVDPETQMDVPCGSVGEIWTRSPQTFVGYWKQPLTTQQSLLDGRWLRTGDAAYLNSDGFLFLKDRLKDMIVSGGENVYPAEVENILARHPAVAECAVIGVPSEKWVETVKAIVKLGAGRSAEAAELISYCKSHLAGYKCPTSIDFVAELPRTPSGKILKHELRAQYSGSN